MRCAYYCTCDHFEFTPLFEKLSTLYRKENLTRYREVIHIQIEGSDLFIYKFGAVVFWEFKEEEEKDFLYLFSTFEKDSLDKIEHEETPLSLTTKTKIRREGIRLAQNDPKTKLAISYGLAQSIKLTLFEEQVEKTIADMKAYPEEMFRKGSISLSRKEIAQKMGQLMMQRNSINLHSEILDTPEFFWEYPELEPPYRDTSAAFEIAQRAEVLNKRLDIIKDFFELLSDELNHQHSSFLEWIIIVLILLEVVLGLAQTNLIPWLACPH